MTDDERKNIMHAQSVAWGDFNCASMYLDASIGIFTNQQSKSLNELYAEYHQKNGRMASRVARRCMGLVDSDQIYS